MAKKKTNNPSHNLGYDPDVVKAWLQARGFVEWGPSPGLVPSDQLWSAWSLPLPGAKNPIADACVTCGFKVVWDPVLDAEYESFWFNIQDNETLWRHQSKPIRTATFEEFIAQLVAALLTNE